MDVLLEYFNSIEPLSEPMLLFLIAQLKKREFKRKEFILKAGDICDKVYFIEKGLVRGFGKIKRKEFSKWFLKQGDFILSERSFFYQTPADEYIQTIEPTTTWFVSYEDFVTMKNEFREFERISTYLLTQYDVRVRERSDAFLNHAALDRYKYLLEKSPDFLSRVPSIYLASYLGMSEYTFSRIKKKL